MSCKFVFCCLLLTAGCHAFFAEADVVGADVVRVDVAEAEELPKTGADKAPGFVNHMLEKIGEESASWSLGIGVAAGAYPHYPGAKQSETVIAPFPFPEYHSDRVDLDRNGLAAKLFASERFELDFSVNGAFPVSANDNDLRAGMADLELMAEFGPELQITLASWDNATLRFDIPARAAFEVTTSDLPRYVGWNTDPRLHFEHKINNWEWEVDVGALWANQKYQALFYSVTEADVTAIRPLFEAESGLLAWRVSATVQRRVGDWIFLGYLRQMNLSSSQNRDSTLLAEDHYLAGGVAAIWMFTSS